MRALFGVVSLLVVLAIVGLLAMKQMKAIGLAAVPAAPASVDAGASAVAPANVREQARQIQQRARSDVTKALEQGAAARGDESSK